MSLVRKPSAGTTRTCPHCRAVILASATVCPSCRKHLRFVPGAEAQPTFSPLRVDGSIRHPNAGEAWEYSVVISIKNDKGEEVGRQVVGVGALQPGEGRTFSFSVDVFAPQGSVIPSWGEGTLPVGASDVVAPASSSASMSSAPVRPAAPSSESRRIR
ncbi:MAG TPA: hypothetical protein VKA54_09090 [Gemmatimonadaceae bacterium]|nr:hypothetical protein [Gemmatimonadaceae bacterium]